MITRKTSRGTLQTNMSRALEGRVFLDWQAQQPYVIREVGATNDEITVHGNYVSINRGFLGRPKVEMGRPMMKPLSAAISDPTVDPVKYLKETIRLARYGLSPTTD